MIVILPRYNTNKCQPQSTSGTLPICLASLVTVGRMKLLVLQCDQYIKVIKSQTKNKHQIIDVQ